MHPMLNLSRQKENTVLSLCNQLKQQMEVKADVKYDKIYY